MRPPRDLTDRQFRAALRARGWRIVLGWIDLSNGTSIGVILTRKRGGWKLDKRASLAKAIREAEKTPEAA